MGRLRARRIAKAPRGIVARSNPIAEEARRLEYFVYGKLRFETDAEGVNRLGQQWVPVEQMPEDVEWGRKEDAFDDAVRDMRAREDSRYIPRGSKGCVLHGSACVSKNRVMTGYLFCTVWVAGSDIFGN